ncbi:MAG: hypothetical protein ACKODK_03370 [Opitutaceae bacterium]
MAAIPREKLQLGAAIGLLLVSAGGFGYLAFRHRSDPREEMRQARLSDAAYQALATEAPRVKTEAWSAPAQQSRGREWVYDTFTPPEIFYSARTRQFTVRPPSSLVDEDAAEAFGVELVAVRPEPFRLQLTGYVGGEGEWRGVFQNVLTGEVFLAGAGRRVPNLALSVRSLDVRLQPVALAESMTTRQRVASAVVRDEKSGRDVTLTHRERVFTGTVFAFVAQPGQSAAREVRSGDTFQIGEATYRVGRIETTPASVELIKESPNLTQPDRRVLTPREAEPADETTPPGTAP